MIESRNTKEKAALLREVLSQEEVTLDHAGLANLVIFMATQEAMNLELMSVIGKLLTSEVNSDDLNRLVEKESAVEFASRDFLKSFLNKGQDDE